MVRTLGGDGRRTMEEEKEIETQMEMQTQKEMEKEMKDIFPFDSSHPGCAA